MNAPGNGQGDSDPGSGSGGWRYEYEAFTCDLFLKPLAWLHIPLLQAGCSWKAFMKLFYRQFVMQPLLPNSL